MSNVDIIRAWKDREYRASLDESQREQVPDNPVGTPLSDEELEQVGGAGTIWTLTTTTVVIPGTEWTTSTTATTDL